MTNFKTLTTSLAVLSIATFSIPVSAGDDTSTNLDEWTVAAAKAIDSEMRYPNFALRNGDSGSTRQLVTIGRDGTVLNTELVTRTRANTLNAASKRVAKGADFPALPSSFEGESLTFALNLNYYIASSPAEQRRLERGGDVRSYRLSENKKAKTRFSSIEIIPAAAE